MKIFRHLKAYILDNFTCPLCGEFSWCGNEHQRCIDETKAWADSYGGKK